jgi:hypothetical protein
MRKGGAVFVGLFVGILAACSSSSSGSPPAPCSTDKDCPSGQGCKTETSDSYCAPLCSVTGDCPTQSQCRGSTDAPKPECKEVGQHTGSKGVCDLYNGPYGPHTC